MKVLHYLTHFSQQSETFIYDLISQLNQDPVVENYVIAHVRHQEDECPCDNLFIVPEDTQWLKKIGRAIINKFPRVYARVIKSQKFIGKTVCGISSCQYVVGCEKDVIGLIADLSPDVIHAHFGSNGVKIGSLLLKYGVNIPLVISCHGTDITSLPHLDREYSKRLTKLFGDNVFFTVSSYFLKKKAIIVGIPENIISVIHPAFNPYFADIRKQNFFVMGDKLKIINIARFVGCKGHEYLIRGFADFCHNVYGNAHLTLIGDGELLPAMKSLVENLFGSFEKVTFIESIPHAKIAGILKEHDVYVQPSIIDTDTYQEEAFGVVLLEAIAVGLPVIATNTGGMSEIVGVPSDFGIIVNQKDSFAIARALESMIAPEYIFRDNLVYAEDRMREFSMTNMIYKVKELYLSATENMTQ